MDIKNLVNNLEEKLLKENNTENNVIKQARTLLKQHLPELYIDYTKHNNLNNRFTTYAADQHAPDFNIVENYIQIREGRNGVGKNFELTTQWDKALQYFEDLCKKYQNSNEYKQFINASRILTPIMKQFENNDQIKDKLNKWFYQCYDVCIWLDNSKYNKTEYTVKLRNNKINIYVGHRGRILASYDTNVTGSQIANIILENLVPKKEYIPRGLRWKINIDEAPYLYAFSRVKNLNYRDPSMAIGAVQPDGSIYYYWIDQSGRETSDTMRSMPSKDVINKLKSEWKKYSQESGEPNPFEQIQENYKGRNMDIKKLNEDLRKAMDLIDKKKSLKENKRILATKDQEYLNKLLNKYGDNASLRDIIKQETKSLKENFDLSENQFDELETHLDNLGAKILSVEYFGEDEWEIYFEWGKEDYTYCLLCGELLAMVGPDGDSQVLNIEFTKDLQYMNKKEFNKIMLKAEEKAKEIAEYYEEEDEEEDEWEEDE